jgi:hypothetical protein
MTVSLNNRFLERNLVYRYLHTLFTNTKAGKFKISGHQISNVFYIFSAEKRNVGQNFLSGPSTYATYNNRADEPELLHYMHIS